ncbi:PQQ-dependent sugar dehydrogenase [Cohnella cellulosilytica]|uniref:PQQ-dependent sugar dehydrogenase n=1 Tax=Cohnella cellulosilytica TaxID=986710 RepID=A0ABW2FJA0_9BACL
MKVVGSSLAGLIALLVLTACWGAGERSGTGTPAPTESARGGAVTLEPAFGDETFDKPVGLERREGDPEAVYIVEQPGRIVSKSLSSPDREAEVVLDIRERVYDKGGEQGLLGLAFDPQRPDDAYVNYTTESHTVIARYTADSDEPGRLDPDSEQVLLTFEQPYSNHNGGQLAFGPDGYLYIAAGDGGNGGDPQNRSQNLDSLLGKILRIDVRNEAEGRKYAIPPDNPFLEGGRPEIYAYGLRNPWRFSFDEETGRLWAADVGQNRFEEINLIERGGNYGWRLMEGTECFNPKNGCQQEDLIDPLFVYGRDDGISVTGGYVYRGNELSDLTGWYVYADYGMGTIWALREREDGTAEHRTLLRSEENITSFGLDAEGELYLCTGDGKVLRMTEIG